MTYVAKFLELRPTKDQSDTTPTDRLDVWLTKADKTLDIVDCQTNDIHKEYKVLYYY